MDGAGVGEGVDGVGDPDAAAAHAVPISMAFGIHNRDGSSRCFPAPYFCISALSAQPI